MSTESTRAWLERAWAAYAAARGKTVAEPQRQALEAEFAEPAEYEKHVRELLGANGVAVPDVPATETPVSRPPASVSAPGPRRQPVGMAPDVRRAMPSLAYRLHEWAETRADRDGEFTCVRQEAGQALRADPRRVGRMMRLHLDAGVWSIAKAGCWGSTTRRRQPRRTVYRLEERFDRERAIAAYEVEKVKALHRFAKARKDTGPQNCGNGPSDGPSVSEGTTSPTTP